MSEITEVGREVGRSKHRHKYRGCQLQISQTCSASDHDIWMIQCEKKGGLFPALRWQTRAAGCQLCCLISACVSAFLATPRGRRMNSGGERTAHRTKMVRDECARVLII